MWGSSKPSLVINNNALELRPQPFLRKTVEKHTQGKTQFQGRCCGQSASCPRALWALPPGMPRHQGHMRLTEAGDSPVRSVGRPFRDRFATYGWSTKNFEFFETENG